MAQAAEVAEVREQDAARGEAKVADSPRVEVVQEPLPERGSESRRPGHLATRSQRPRSLPHHTHSVTAH